AWAARVQFAQSQIVPAHPKPGDNQPHLIGSRKTLLLVRPLKADGVTPIVVVAKDKSGKVLGELRLDAPGKLPKTAYYLDGAPDEPVDFEAPAGTVANVISNKNDIEKLSDPQAPLVLERLRKNPLVEIQTADGVWVRDIHAPDAKGLDGKLLRVTSRAGYTSTVHYGGRTVVISRNQTFQFKVVRGRWVLKGELDNQGLTYSTDTWSGILPAEWLSAGLKLQFRQGAATGELNDLKVGAPSELLIHTIDVGMLVPPRDRFEFAKDPTAHREYFQTVPTSRMIVSQYAPLHLREVMLPDGKMLVELDPSKGDWHNGTMRQRIGKELISLGIDNANYGINSTAGEGESSHPYIAAQLAAHNTSGKYSNGIVVHGGSGGGGIVTLDNSIGNELSHEVGHNYGLGHYVGGFKGSVHRSADQINSTWGWDADKNRFLPNFSPIRSGKDACLDGQCQSPFDGREFGMDAMAGGAPLSSFNRFTLYTPNTAAIIQQFLESKAVFDAGSPTGFRKWNAESGAMEPYVHRLPAEQITAPVSDLSEAKIASLLADYDVVKVAMQDGDWTKNINVPAASGANRGRSVSIDHQATYDSVLAINGGQVKVSRGFKKSYTSDGKKWNEGLAGGQTNERKPREFGVPVTTLVGYYDPKGELNGYIYPALHGAYGFTYADDGKSATDGECQLVVETKSGELRFRLANRRLSAKVMNKFHVNVPESSEPKSVSLVCGGKVVDKRSIVPPSEKLTYTVHGSSSGSSSTGAASL
ncbi:MAG TPA: M66 family metalloprotease, partial [Pirellulaceae bacterium]|nr:M66 family metalloprotease [Pirellulaceae bacterium]